ncbi:hypothetical protein D5F01_LYC21014 [Larimichthys crocea]|uniref:PDZ domain-containing protein n=1 Tax=Larimichthys crocea TaxID=215358 RepID=A0A6G0HN46_LARCR|nr:hypothetical protein D5F01_LYC21014 [Larimichthys crocea]
MEALLLVTRRVMRKRWIVWKAEESMEEFTLAENMDSADSAAEPEDGLSDWSGEEKEAVPNKDGDKGKTKPGFLRSNYQVAPLPEYPQKNDLSNRDVSCSDMLKADLCLLPHSTNMDTFTHQRRTITRSCSPGHTLTRSATFHALTQASENREEEGSPQQRRITVEAKLCGADIASMDVNTLDVLHITTLEDREQLLSAIYNELHPPTTITQRIENLLEVTSSDENSSINKTAQVNQQAKEERIKELNQQVDSLQNVILQVQELHHSLVAFCSELKNMDGDVNVDRLGSAELKQRLELVKSQLNDKRQSLQALRDDINNPTAHKKKQLDVRLLEKMKLNCQVFKEEISMVHLNRQVAHLQNALQESNVKEKAREKSLAIGSLSQLVSMESPAMLLVVQENQNPDGHYGFTCDYREGSGLVVVKVDSSHLCVDDRLVEVNGVPVVNSTQEELTDVLLQGPSAQIVVLRQPPTTLTSQQHSLLLQHVINPDPMQTICPEKDMVNMKTPPIRKLMAI